MSRCKRIRHGLLAMLACWLPLTASASLDLSAARSETLNNGMTLIVLEEHSVPVVSVQMLYRVGAKHEIPGATGLAHFLEHLAFRTAEGFEGASLVSPIYAVGGEWHGYTWLDQTTYFATAPRDELDLLLRIEAARMSHLNFSSAEVIAERGAVLAEMHGYENDPDSVLLDQLMYLTFLAHPYRNNTIGWENDVAQTGHPDLAAFYRQHYQPANAILAVVGDVRKSDVVDRVSELFAAVPSQAPTPEPGTVEPMQSGERRLQLHGAVDRKYFKIAWRAPAASHPDYAPFLLVQELLAGGSGVNFLQNDWGTPVRPGAPLTAVPAESTTWFPPAAQSYVFVIGGVGPADADENEIELSIDDAIEQLRLRMLANDPDFQAELTEAKQRVLRELVFDIQTTEDAAHQLAFFAGLGALENLIELPSVINRTTANQVSHVMEKYLRKTRKNVAWYGPAEEPAVTPSSAEFVSELTSHRPVRYAHPKAVTRPATNPELASPVMLRLTNGLPVILQSSGLSSTVSLRVITPTVQFAATVPAVLDRPGRGMATLKYDILAEELNETLARARTALESATRGTPGPQIDRPDPVAVLQHEFETSLGLDLTPAPVPLSAPASLVPFAMILTGDFDPADARQAMENLFGGFEYRAFKPPAEFTVQGIDERHTRLAVNMAQEQLGYVVPAPGPGHPQVAVWEMTRYIFSHEYEGRLGMVAISERGLVYYIGGGYHTDGRNGWITLEMGVDPHQVLVMKQLLREELQDLKRHPPTQDEIDEARHHLLGRFVSAAQSNPELADRLARHWLWFGRPVDFAEFQSQLAAVTREDIIAVLPAFTRGAVVTVTNPSSTHRKTKVMKD